MKLLCVSSKLQTTTPLPQQYENYYWEYQCGNGVSIATTPGSSSHLVKLPILSSSPSLIQFTITILCSFENNLIILGTKNVKLKDIILNEIQTIEIKLESNNNKVNDDEQVGVLPAMTVSCSYQILTASCIELLELLSTGIAINTMINFVDIPREDISLRILNDKGVCLALSSIKQQQSSTYFIFNLSTTNLEISVASKSTGVVQMPFEINTPMVLKLEGFPSGYILLCINSTRGHTKDIERTRTLLLDTISYHSTIPNPDANSPAHVIKSDGSLEQTSPLPKITNKEYTNLSSNIIYHIQNLLLDGEEETPPNPTLLSSGVLYGPLISRLEIPKFSTSFSLNSFYSLPFEQPNEESTSLNKDIHRLPSDFRGILITENEYLSTILKLRISFLRTLPLSPSLIGAVATSSSIDSNAIQEGPCGLYLASGVLREVDRISHALPDSIKHPFGQTEINTAADSGVKCLFTCYLEGTLDHVSSDIPDNFFQIGEKVTCHVVIYSSYIPPTKASHSDIQNSFQESTDLLPSVSVLSHISTSPEIVTDSFSHEINQITSPIPSVMSVHETEFDLHKRKPSAVVGYGNDIIQVLTNQLYEKQRIIDRLLDEGSMKAEIISKHGAEILIFQKEILNLKTKLTEHQAALSYREQESDEAVRLAQDGLKDPNILYQSNRQMLINAVVETSIRYNKVNKERVEYKKLISESTTIKRQFQEIQQSYLELQEANHIQSQYIDKIERQLAKVETYQSTILMQEKVINKMQTVIENHFKSSSEGSSQQKSSNSLLLGNQLKMATSNSSQNIQPQLQPQAHAQSQSMASVEEVEQLKKKCSQLEAQIKSKDIRIESLQEQLTSSSQEAARLIASLRAKLFELELTADSSSKPSSVLHPHLPSSSTYNHLVPFHSPNPFHSYENEDYNSKFTSQKSTPKTSTHPPPPLSNDSFLDLAGNIFQQQKLNSRDVTSRTQHSSQRQSPTDRQSPTQQSKSSNITNIPADISNKMDLYPKNNYISSAYRINSKTGSPRPVSPSNASSHPTEEDSSPRISKPSNSMKNLFYSKYDKSHEQPLPPPSSSSSLPPPSSISSSLLHEQDHQFINQRKDLNKESLIPPSPTSLLLNKPPLRVSPPQSSTLNPSPLRSPQNKSNSSHHSNPSSRPHSNHHSHPPSHPHPQPPLHSSSSPSSLPASPHQQNISNDILNALLQQTSSSSGPSKKINDSPTSHSPSSGRGIDMSVNEDILDGLLKRRGIYSSQRSSRSADSSR